MNAMGHALPGTPQMGTLTRNGSHRSVRSRPTPAATTGHNTLSSVVGGGGGHSSAQPQQPQPDILKSTPDHQADSTRLHRTDSKKRTHLDSGVA
nr:unnamed protein product [Timema bartmani]CAD7456719.1 unnamed protein product [Timema tahoe]CAD7574256.1 unnamed protein product [Timema californicum]